MSENTPLVSVNCITYNQVRFIRQCLDGILAQQTDFDFEILVHDDASTDGTADIIREYETRYPDKFRVVYQTENQWSRHKAISATFQYPRARGKYIAECEGDDYWTDPHKLQRQVDFLESHPDYGLVFTDYDRYVEDSGRFIRKCFASGYTPRPLNFGEYLVSAGYIAPPTWVFRRDLLPKWDKCYVDGSFFLSLSLWAQCKVRFMPESTAVYRVWSGGVSHVRDASQFSTRIKGVFDIQREIMRTYPGLITPDIRARVNRRIFNISLFSNTLPDKHTSELGRRYARLVGDRRQYTKLSFGKFAILRPMLRMMYKRRRHVRYN